jgi:hypothetical protein
MRRRRIALTFIMFFFALDLRTQSHEDLLPNADQSLRRAVAFFRGRVAIHGGYLWRYSSDLSRREGEGKATDTMIWVQPPGTPAVGLAFVDTYELTYSDEDTPTHYAFVTPYRLDAMETDYRTVRKEGSSSTSERRPDRPTTSVSALAEKAKAVIDALDARGAWVERGGLRYHGEDDPTQEVIDTQTFIRNVGILGSFIAAGKR